MIWSCNGLRKKQRAVGGHLLHDKEIRLNSILLLIKLKYVNKFTGICNELLRRMRML